MSLPRRFIIIPVALGILAAGNAIAQQSLSSSRSNEAGNAADWSLNTRLKLPSEGAGSNQFSASSQSSFSHIGLAANTAASSLPSSHSTMSAPAFQPGAPDASVTWGDLQAYDATMVEPLRQRLLHLEQMAGVPVQGTATTAATPSTSTQQQHAPAMNTGQCGNGRCDIGEATVCAGCTAGNCPQNSCLAGSCPQDCNSQNQYQMPQQLPTAGTLPQDQQNTACSSSNAQQQWK